MWIYFLVCQNYTVGTKKPVVATLYLRCVTYSVLLNNCPSHCRKCPCANFRRGWPYWASANKVWQYELKAMIVKLVIFTYMTTAGNQKCLFLCLSLSLPQKLCFHGKPQKWLFVMSCCRPCCRWRQSISTHELIGKWENRPILRQGAGWATRYGHMDNPMIIRMIASRTSSGGLSLDSWPTTP